MAKILLISPPAWGLMLSMTSHAPTPPLGLAILKNNLENNGHEIFILDTGVTPIDLIGIKNIMTTFKPDIVGITTYYQNPSIVKIAEIARKEIPNALITIGGVIATKLYKYILELNKNTFDIVIKGNGFDALEYAASLTGDIEDKRKKLSESKIFQRINNGFNNIDDDHIINYSFNQYLGNISPIVYKRLHYVFQSGCPFSCSFCVCSNTKNNLTFDAESIVREINFMHCVYGHDLFLLFDETTTSSKVQIKTFKKHLNNYCDERLSFWCGTRNDCIDDEMIDLLSDIGIKRLFLGIESTKPESQRYVGNKGKKIDEIKLKIEKLKNKGIKTETSILLGLPFETEEDFFTSIKQTKAMGFDDIMFNIVALIPGTRLYNNFKKYGYESLGKAENLNELFNQDNYQVNGNKFFINKYIRPEAFDDIKQKALDILNYDQSKGKQISHKKNFLFRLPF